MRNWLLLTWLIWLGGSGVTYQAWIFESPKVPSTIGTPENPNQRFEFEVRQLRDPSTGQIPGNIRKLELDFSKNHPRKSQGQRGVQSQDWEFAGPVNVGGRTRAVAIDISDPSEQTIIAAGVSGGIWKTTNLGSTWTRTSDPDIRNGATAIAQDARSGKEDIWYVGTGELLGNSARSGPAPFRGDGLLKSTDGGESWFRLESTQDSEPSRFGSQFQYIWNLVTDHTDLTHDVVLVAAYGGILRSEDGGESWSAVLGEELINLPDDANLNEVIAPFYTNISQTEGGYFYAYLSATSIGDDDYENSGVYFSRDGLNWIRLFDAGSTRMVMDMNDDGGYMLFSENSQVALYRMYTEGLDSGSPKFDVFPREIPDFDDFGSFNIQSGYNMMLKMHPSLDDVVFIGATNLYRSSDGFESTVNIDWIGGYDQETNSARSYENHHPDQHDLLFFKNDPNKALSANDGGLQIATLTGTNDPAWQSLNNGYVTSQFYTVHISKSEATESISGGLQDNGSYVGQNANPNVYWTQTLTGDGSFAHSTPLEVFWYFSFQNGGIYRFNYTSEGSIFARVDPSPGPSQTESEYIFINPYVLDPQNHSVMYLAGGNAIWRNNNLAQVPIGLQEPTPINWDLISNSLVDSGLITALEITNDSKYLYYGTSDGGVCVLANPRNEPVVSKLQALGDGVYVSSLAANPLAGEEVLITVSNYGIPSIYHSTNAGVNIQDVSGNLEEFSDGTGNGPSVRWAEIVPINDGAENRYFVGTSVGLYSTEQLSGEATVWEKEGEGTIGNSVIRMTDYRSLDGKMVVGTHGNGVYRTFIDDAYLFTPEQEETPENLVVYRSYPNPFQDKVNIEFDIPELDYVRVDIYDLFGSHIRNLFFAPQFAGQNVVTWDGRNWKGDYAKDGMYVYRIYYGDKVVGGRMVFNRR